MKITATHSGYLTSTFTQQKLPNQLPVSVDQHSASCLPVLLADLFHYQVKTLCESV